MNRLNGMLEEGDAVISATLLPPIPPTQPCPACRKIKYDLIDSAHPAYYVCAVCHPAPKEKSA